MKLYYQDDSVTLYHGSSIGGMAGMEDASVKAILTDPPYTERTHEGARSNSKDATAGGRVLSGSKAAFGSITDEELRKVMVECGRVSRSWVVATLAYQHSFEFDIEPPEGLRMMRVGVWVKTNPMPQISADRPGTGWESIAYMHRADTKPAWNGGGKHGNYILPTAQGEGHPTSKPLSMVSDWVRRFTEHGDTILDPFAGSGTTLRAAVDNGRKAIGYEINEAYCEVIAKRLSQGALDLFGSAA